MLNQFVVGQTYSTRSVCDWDCIFSITIKSRTAKTIKTECGKTLRCSVYEGNEQVKPFGTYSMCPVIGADDKDLTKPQAPAKPAQTETLAELLAEGQSLFTPEQFDEIKNVIATVVRPVEPKTSAKVYNFADYKRKA